MVQPCMVLLVSKSSKMGTERGTRCHEKALTHLEMETVPCDAPRHL